MLGKTNSGMTLIEAFGLQSDSQTCDELLDQWYNADQALFQTCFEVSCGM